MIADQRRKRLTDAMQESGLDVLLVYGNAWQGDYLRYATDFGILEGQALAIVRIELLAVQCDSGAALFGHVHSHICAPQQRLRVGSVLWADRDSDAGSYEERDAIDAQGRAEGLQEIMCEFLGHRRVAGRQEHRELIPAQPRNFAPLPHTFLEPEGYLTQQSVAMQVPECVIDFLEPIEVRHQQDWA